MSKVREAMKIAVDEIFKLHEANKKARAASLHEVVDKNLEEMLDYFDLYLVLSKYYYNRKDTDND